MNNSLPLKDHIYICLANNINYEDCKNNFQGNEVFSLSKSIYDALQHDIVKYRSRNYNLIYLYTNILYI